MPNAVSKAKAETSGDYVALTETPKKHGESTAGGKKIIRGPNGITVLDGQVTPPVPRKGEFHENLASRLNKGQRQSLARRLLEYAEIDEDSRKDWSEMERRGLALMGSIDIPNDDEIAGDVNAPGEAQVKLPLLAQAVTTFGSRAMSELFPATGPVKGMIVGEKTAEKAEQQGRIEDFSNYWLTVEDTGYYPDSDQMLHYLPIAGDCMRKAGIEWVTNIPTLRYVKSVNFIVPYSATTLEDATRYAHVYDVSGQDLRRAQQSGMWKDVQLQRPERERARRSKMADKSDGRVPTEHDDDRSHRIYEYHIDLELDEDPMSEIRAKNLDQSSSTALLPYIVIVEQDSNEILMVRRNWRKADKLRKKIVWFAHHKFFPGLGFYGWGYPHLVGKLQKCANDVANALLDAGYAANFRGGFVTKEGKVAGLTGDIQMELGKFKVIEGTFEELSKAIWSPQYPPPSPALAAMLEQMIELFRSFASITEAAVGDADNRGPVGTTIALIEQSSVVPTAIHRRLHQSIGCELKMWAELVPMHMPAQYPFEFGGKSQALLATDFDGRIDIIPVSDPNIWSNTQRIALCQGVLELQGSAPDLYKPPQKIAAHRRMLAAMKVPDLDEVAPTIETPKYLDPISEGMTMLMGGMVRAFETQNHAAHNAVHSNQRAHLLGNPAFVAMLPERQQMVLAAFDSHIADHMGMEFRQQIAQQAGVPMPPLDEMGMPQELPPEIEAQVTAAIVQKLPPPPPPIQSDGGAQAVMAKAQADIEAKKMQSEAQVERDTEAWAAEEMRKEKEFESEQERKRREFELDTAITAHTADADNQRADMKVRGDVVREGAKVKMKLHGEEAKSRQKLAHTDQTHKQGMGHADEKTVQDLAHKDVGAEQDATIKDRGAAQDRDIKGKGAAADRDNKAKGAEADREMKAKGAEADRANKSKGAEQDRTEKGKDSAQDRRLANTEHEQGTRHTEEQHAQAVKILEEDAAVKRELGDKAGKQKLRQSKDQGEEKLKQQRLQRREKAAAAKKAAKKSSK